MDIFPGYCVCAAVGWWLWLAPEKLMLQTKRSKANYEAAQHSQLASQHQSELGTLRNWRDIARYSVGSWKPQSKKGHSVALYNVALLIKFFGVEVWDIIKKWELQELRMLCKNKYDYFCKPYNVVYMALYAGLNSAAEPQYKQTFEPKNIKSSQRLIFILIFTDVLIFLVGHWKVLFLQNDF